LVELLLVQILELLVQAAAVVDPLPRRLVQGTGEVQQDAFPLVPCGQVPGTVQLALLAAAGGLAAGASAFDQATAQERLLAD
jgi:hypothetical protein